MFLYGSGLILSLLTVWLRDLPYIVGIGMQILFWLSPITYARRDLEGIFRTVVDFNPITYFLEFTNFVFLGYPISAVGVLAPIGIAFATLTVGLFVANKLQGRSVILL